MTEIFAIDQIGMPILPLMIILPVLVAVSLYLINSIALQRTVAFSGIVAELILGLIAVFAYEPGAAEIQLVHKAEWMSAIGATFHFGVDGVSLFFLPLTAFVILIAMTSGASSKSSRWFWANLLLLQAASVGVYTALDLVAFFLFWELMLIPSYFLIRMWGVGSDRQAAAMKYVMYMLIGSVPLLIAIAAIGSNLGTFDLVALKSMEIPYELQTTLFMLLFIAFAVKAPLPPFHTWLPSVAMEGPAGIAIFLVGLKMGTFGMIKVLLPIAPEVAMAWQTQLIWFGIFAMLYGGFIALAQKNLRRMLAYASVSHVGMVVAGIFTLSESGLQGSVMAMINMALASSLMMFIAGRLYQRLGTTELSGLGGIARHAPLMAFAFIVAGLASIGMPGTSGFQGEFPILLGIFQTGYLMGAFALIGVILGAGYMLWFYERAFFGPAKSKDIKDFNRTDCYSAVIAVALLLAIGIGPIVMTKTISNTTNSMVALIDTKSASTVESASLTD